MVSLWYPFGIPLVSLWYTWLFPGIRAIASVRKVAAKEDDMQITTNTCVVKVCGKNVW